MFVKELVEFSSKLRFLVTRDCYYFVTTVKPCIVSVCDALSTLFDLMPLTYILRSIDDENFLLKLGFLCTCDSCVYETLHNFCP